MSREIPKSVKEDAAMQIADKIQQIKTLMQECKDLADSAMITFHLNPMDIYGAGLSYTPKELAEEEGSWVASDSCSYEDEYEGWQSSSQNC